ncbi:uncharacterized protein F4822DRAFT_413514 [Hypoxylon trugodes]|uniref:uncharacterized protein n=1 Tax=Hypoxylon trugodes TaxID=326681 RepID=UPI00219618B6|nr:uncharacterized protein F4822DRAFT_413514 [Hypoxylon trugodes]KAI1385578.1 hypothetical protein F4822DRAFT_413514 [Hypoxylon trugodes]
MLERLSTELIEHIAFSLEDRADLLTLRLVSRRLNNATYRVFGRAWFGTILLKFIPESLPRVADIAHHPLLRESVRHIKVGIGNEKQYAEFGFLNPALPSAKDAQDLLASFPNCDEITVTDYYDDCTIQDGFSALYTVNFMFLVLARLRIKTFNIYVRNIQAFKHAHLLFDTVKSAPFRSSWSHIQHINFWWQPGIALAKITSNLVLEAVNLRTLILKCVLSQVVNQLLQRIAESPTVPAVKHLELSAWRPLSPEIFSSAILRFKDSLESLTLYRTRTDWEPFFALLGKESFPHLGTITFRGSHNIFLCPLRMNQNALSQYGGDLEFTLRDYAGKSRVCGMRYRSSPPGIQHMLQTLGRNSIYTSNSSRRERSPGLPDMKTYTGDTVGRVVNDLL